MSLESRPQGTSQGDGFDETTLKIVIFCFIMYNNYSPSFKSISLFPAYRVSFVHIPSYYSAFEQIL